MLANLSLQSERFAVGWKKQFDSGGAEPDTMVELFDVVSFIDSPDDHHSHQNLQIIDLARIPGK